MDVEFNKDNYNYSFKDHRTFKNGKLTGKTFNYSCKNYIESQPRNSTVHM